VKFVTVGLLRRRFITSVITALKLGSRASSVFDWTITRSPAGVLNSLSSKRSIRPDSRTPASATSSVFVPITIVPSTKAPRQNASQPKMAIFRCLALQWAIRAARLRDSDMAKPPNPVCG
jgi:hypothetical protein